MGLGETDGGQERKGREASEHCFVKGHCELEKIRTTLR